MRAGRFSESIVFRFIIGLCLGVIFTFSCPSNAARSKCPEVFSSFGLKSNPQLLIWKLEEAGRTEAAKKLKARVVNTLQHGEVVIAKRADDSVWFLEFKDGSRGVWKIPDEDLDIFPETLKMEVTAFDLDQMVGANLVPVSAERTYNGVKGVVQIFVRDTENADRIFDPHSLKLWDFLIKHQDRIPKNYLVADGRTIAVDNDGTFAVAKRSELSSPRFDLFIEEQLSALEASGNSTEARAKAIAQIAPTLISKTVVDNLKSTTDQQWKKGLRHLTPQQLKEFLERKNRAVEAIDRAHAVLGDALYPSGQFSVLSRNQWKSQAARLSKLLRNKPPKELREKIKKTKSILDGHVVRGVPLSLEDIQTVEATLKETESLP